MIEVVELPLEDIHFNKKNEIYYESLVNEDGSINIETIATLTASIEKMGQLEPATVVRDVVGYRIISGNKRYAALKILKSPTLKAIILPKINEKDEDALIVTHNLQREKSYTEKLAEFKVYRKIFDITDAQIDKDNCKFTIQKNENIGREEITISNFAASILHLKSTKLHELLFVHKNRPELIKDIDDGIYSVHSAYEYVKKENEQTEFKNIPLKLSEPDLNHLIDSDRKYTDSIISIFRQKVKEAKDANKLSLIKILKESINEQEQKIVSEFGKQEELLYKLFDKMDVHIQDGDFSVLSWEDKIKPIDMDEFENLTKIKRDNNKKYNRENTKEMRELSLRNLTESNNYPQLIIKGLSLDSIPYKSIKDDILEYLLLFSRRYTAQKEIKGGHLTPQRRKEINREISSIDKALTVYLRIICKLTRPLK